MLYIILCFAVALITAAAFPRDQLENAFGIGCGIALILFLAGSALFIFAIVPALKKTQAKEDFLKYDFTEYSSSEECEIFETVYPVCRYVLTPSPFDCDESVTLYSEKALSDYMEQFTGDRLIASEPLERTDYPDPFFIGYFDDDRDRFTPIKIEKKVCGDKETVIVYEIHRAEFTESGVRAGETVYPYEEISADVFASFGHDTCFTVSIRFVMFVSDLCILSFALSTRIAAIADRFGITIKDRSALDYILADPMHAFEQTANQLVLKKLK